MSDIQGPIIVGELNPWGTDPDMAMYPLPTYTAGGRMQRIVLGIHRWRYVDLDRYNLCVGNWSMPKGRAEAKRLIEQHPERVFALLGRKVAVAFGMAEPAFRVLQHRQSTFVLLPHPSGRNRMWGKPGTLSACRKVLGEVLPDFPIGEIDR